MILVCPNCVSRYQVDDTRIPAGGRTVRCSSCKHIWHEPAPLTSLATAAPKLLVLACRSCKTQFQIDEKNIPPAGRKVRCSHCHHIWHQFRPGPAKANAQVKLAAVRAALISARPAAPDLSIAAVATVPTPQSALVAPPHVSVGTPPSEASAPITASEQINVTQPAFPPYTEVTIEENILSFFARACAVFAHLGSTTWIPRNSLGIKKAILGTGTILLLTATVFGGKTLIDHRQDVVDKWSATKPIYTWLGFAVESSGIDLRNVSYRREATINFGTILVIDGTLENSSSKTLPVPHTINVSLTDKDDNSLYHTVIVPTVAELGGGESVGFETSIYNAPPGATQLEVTLAR